MPNREKERKRNDLLFAGIVILLALVIYLLYTFVYGKEGAFVQVQSDGKGLAVYALHENREVPIVYGENEGSNILVIADGKAYVKEADCPDKLCVKQKSISRTGEAIVCLPHKLVITVIGGEEAEYDGIAR